MNRSLFLLPMVICFLLSGSLFAQPTLKWLPDSLTLVEPHANYGRIKHLDDKTLIVTYEKRRRIWTKLSTDNGKTWQQPNLAAEFAHGSPANPELLILKNETILLCYNERPRDPNYHFTIRTAISEDRGKTWSHNTLAYQADTEFKNGCWEPAALQLPNGQIQLYFANENPYRKSNEQEISMLTSDDNGRSWSNIKRVCFRKDHRDGMPVPLRLNDGKTIVVAIEDNGIDGKFKPAIVSTKINNSWSSYVSAKSPRRWPALKEPLPSETYAGAPYITQFPSGPTVLSFQSDLDHSRPVMFIALGDATAKNFTTPTAPFPTDKNRSGQWNSLFIKNPTTVTALTNTTINNTPGLYTLDATLQNPTN